MDTAEVDAAIEDLEIRLERLRALYEQYFMGIEKLQPTVPRKDVDRRIWELRRAQIRNTAKRFKLQTIIQRYNTFQQYWQRICRDIENGTYKRHLLRAESTQGASSALTAAARKRLGLGPRRELAAAPEETAPAVAAGPEPVSSVPAARPSSVAPAGPSSRPRPKLDLDLQDLLINERRPSAPAAAGPVAASPPKAGPPPLPPRRAAQPPPAASPVAAAPGATAPKPPADSQAVAAPPEATASKPGRPPPPRVVTVAAARPKPESIKPSPMVKIESERPVAPVSPAAAAAKHESIKPSPTVKIESSPPAAPGTAAAATAPRRPAARKSTAEPAAPTKAAETRQRQGGTEISEDRVRELHGRLVDAKRKNNDPGKVSLDGFAHSLRDAEQRLRAKYAGRKIDFDVVVRDGKAILKPIVR